MAICDACNKEMLAFTSCDLEQILVEGVVYDRIRHGDETCRWNAPNCHDCGVPRSGLHHPGCDVEECPDCGMQLISCWCDKVWGDEPGFRMAAGS